MQMNLSRGSWCGPNRKQFVEVEHFVPTSNPLTTQGLGSTPLEFLCLRIKLLYFCLVGIKIRFYY